MTVTALPLTLFGYGSPEIAPSWSLTRTMLDEQSWIDHAVGFLNGADNLLVDLDEQMDWFRGRRLMYGTWHEEPRRTATEANPGTTLPTVIDTIRHTLSERYGAAFRGLFCNYYETGQDSVAWHADRIGRTEVDPLVAIVSLGGPRTFRLRPKQISAKGERAPDDKDRSDRATSHSIVLASGDLLVMGGATQHHWEHAIPKTAYAAPRMSITMRASLRRDADLRQQPRWLPQHELRGVQR